MDNVNCPPNPDAMVREIVRAKRLALTTWGTVATIILVALVFLGWALLQLYLQWRADNRDMKVRIKGRNNIFDAADDNYDPYPGENKVVPSGRTLRQRMQSMNVSHEVLDSQKDRYKDEKKEDDGRGLFDWTWDTLFGKTPCEAEKQTEEKEENKECGV